MNDAAETRRQLIRELAAMRSAVEGLESRLRQLDLEHPAPADEKQVSPQHPARVTIPQDPDLQHVGEDSSWCDNGRLSSDKLYRCLVETSKDVIWAVDLNLRYTFVSPSVTSVLGYTVDEIMALNPLDGLTPESRAKVVKAFQEEMALEASGSRDRHASRTGEIQRYRKDGSTLWEEITTTFLRDGQGKPVGLLGISRDVTNRKRMEEDLRRARDELEKRITERTADLMEANQRLSVEIEERKNAEFALQASEQTLKRILTALPVGIGLSLNRTMQWVNDAWVRMFGFGSPEDCVGRPARELYPSGKEYERSGRALYANLASGVVNEIDARMIRRDGSPFDAYIRLTALDPADLGAGSIAVISDISERKSAEAALEKSKAMLNSVLHAAPIGIGIVTDRHIGWTNRMVSRMTGYSADELFGKSSRILYESEDEFDRVGKLKYAEIETRGIGQIETKWKRKDGSISDILLSSVPVVPGDLSKGVVFTAMDMTGQKKSQEVRTRLATAVEQAEETIVITDPAGTIQYVNPAFERTTGYSKDEVLGGNPRILKSGEHDSEFYDKLWSTVKAGKVWKGRFINRRKDGTLFHEDATISPVRDSTGRIVNFVAVKRDVTQELALQQQLLHAQKMEAMGTLAGGIAHDFNNLLQVTLGFSELLLSDRNEEDAEYADLMKIFQAAKNGADLVQRLLTFSRKVEPKYNVS